MSTAGTQAWRSTWLVARTIGLEAVRRGEVYAVVGISVVLIALARYIGAADLQGLGKFYREVALQVMNSATALLVVYLAARQLPREFEWRTLHVLLAKPLSRWGFLVGKFAGVVLAGIFCYLLFMLVFLLGHWALGVSLNYALFAQAVYLQILSLSVLTALTLCLSMVLTLPAAITIGALLFLLSQVFLNLMSFLYDHVGPVQQAVLLVLHYLIPQLTLLDLSAKVVHEVWPPLPFLPMVALTAYALAYIGIFLGLTYLLFRRRPL
jgi:ABC-type transport system involved in multi-copper enzyme maturation permease subunit